jgi:hypothetical protein
MSCLPATLRYSQALPVSGGHGGGPRVHIASREGH